VEGNYSTVDEDMPKTSENRTSMDGDYSNFFLFVSSELDLRFRALSTTA
jgi:hypothetical protein